MTPLLEVSGVSHSYHTMEGETKALSHITFSIFNGEFVAVVGPSGCGKTTLLTLLDGLAAPEAGTILVNGRPVSEARQHIGYMFQRDRLLEWRTILANVSLGLEIQKRMTSQAREERATNRPVCFPWATMLRSRGNSWNERTSSVAM